VSHSSFTLPYVAICSLVSQCIWLSYHNLKVTVCWVVMLCSSVHFEDHNHHHENHSFLTVLKYLCFGFLDYGIVWSDRWIPTFQRNVLPVSSGKKMQAVDSFKMLVTTFQTTLCHKLDDHNLNLHCHQISGLM
jgi:hypothetical protein